MRTTRLEHAQNLVQAGGQAVSWSFETDSEFQEQLNWIETFT